MGHLSLIVGVVFIFGVAVVWLVSRRRRFTPPPPVVPEPREDLAAREARHQDIDQRGTDLLDRRIELDQRRGTLTGDSALYDEFDRLERRYRAGDISEDEFEAGKIRILGG